MSTLQTVQLEPRHKPVHMFRILAGMGALCALLLAGVHTATAPIIRENQQQLLQQSIRDLFPNTHKHQAYQIDAKGNITAMHLDTVDADFYHVFNARNEALGFAIKARGMGYQDAISILYAYRPQQQALTSYIVLSSRETPGLGTKIETDTDFLAQFKTRPLPLHPDGTRLLHPIKAYKKGETRQAWHVDTISGATISSRALIRTLSRSSEFWLPKLAEFTTTRLQGSQGVGDE